MNVRVTKRAQVQIDRAAQWWDENRDLAPEAFDEDLAKAFLLLTAEAGVGAPVLVARAKGCETFASRADSLSPLLPGSRFRGFGARSRIAECLSKVR